MMVYNNLVFRPFLIRRNWLSAAPPLPQPYDRVLVNRSTGKITTTTAVTGDSDNRN